jgi:hypothetical protein
VIEQELRALPIAFPPEPDLVPAVLARLERRRRRWLVPALVTAAALGALFAIPQTRAAILDFFRIGGVTVERVETQPAAPTVTPAFGREVTLEEARAAVEAPLAVPPDFRAVYLDEPFVTIEVRRGLYLTQWSGTGPPLLEKQAGPGTRFHEVGVYGNFGLWIEGARHVVLRGPERRSAGNVLIWVDRGITYRLEGDVTRAEALGVARNLQRP